MGSNDVDEKTKLSSVLVTRKGIIVNNEFTEETILSATKSVSHINNLVLRPAGKWSRSVHALLRHLETVGFTAAPHVIGNGFAPDGRETLSYIEGEFVHPGPWSDEGIVEVGRLLRRLHDAASSFEPDADAVWQPWFLRELGVEKRVLGHGDFAPWNMVTQAGMPIALIDWEYAGPIDPMIELARVCWLFPQLHDDDVAERVGLPPLEVRARQLRLLVDAYGVTYDQRHSLLDRIIEVAVFETAQEAIEGNVTPDSQGPLWGFAWRARAAAWIMRNRPILEQALLEMCDKCPRKNKSIF
jgi:Phosphotransferase enzyme family